MFVFLILLLFAVIFVVAGAAMLYFRAKNREKSGLMSRTQTSSASEVPGLAPGTLVEVKGTLRCEEPLVSEMAGERCAYYRATVTREYRERERPGDDDRVGSNRRTEVLSQNERFAPFSVEDATGAVAVDAEGAEVDARQVVDRFERATGEGPSITLAGATLNIGGGERTIGYRYTESVLPVDVPVYVLGTVGRDGAIGAAEGGERGQRFVVSYRSEEALGASLGRTALWLGVGGIAAILVGLVLLVVGVLILLL